MGVSQEQEASSRRQAQGSEFSRALHSLMRRLQRLEWGRGGLHGGTEMTGRIFCSHERGLEGHHATLATAIFCIHLNRTAPDVKVGCMELGLIAPQ